jgi:predicted Zn-dependent protease
MDFENLELLYQRARNALRQGLFTEAADLFRYLAQECDTDARFLSYRGLLTAIRDKQVAQGAKDCKRAITLAPSEPVMYLNLSQVYERSGQHHNAVTTLRKAVRAGVKSKAIMDNLQRLSPRSGGPIPSLHRDHFLNKHLGRLLARWFGYRPRVPVKNSASRARGNGRTPAPLPQQASPRR